MAEEEDLTEKMLVTVYEMAVDELRRCKRGDPTSIPATARVAAASRELSDYRKKKKKKK